MRDLSPEPICTKPRKTAHVGGQMSEVKPNMITVDIITDKLREQRIDDHSKTKSHIKLIQPGDGYRLSKNAEATIEGKGKKLWKVPLNSGFLKPKSPTKGAVTFVTGQGYCSLGVSPVSDPPTKRHCRSLQESGDSSQNKWQPQESHVWKPISLAASQDYERPLFCPSDPMASAQTPVTMVHGIEGSHSGFEHCFHPLTHVYPTSGDTGFVFTPPESPVPRPSSASTCTGRHDYMFSPVGAPWLEQSQRKLDAFQNRSLSCEDRISSASSSGSTTSVPGCLGNHNASHPYHHHSHPHHHHQHQHIPRCRSQPSMTTKKFGMKRRRDSDQRPSLNFQKMTEKRVSKFHEEWESVMSLMPIASSPLDNDLPIKRMLESRSSPINEAGAGRSDSAEFLDSEASDGGEGPVNLLGEEGCDMCCEEQEEIFTLQEDLDLEQIEND